MLPRVQILFRGWTDRSCKRFSHRCRSLPLLALSHVAMRRWSSAEKLALSWTNLFVVPIVSLAAWAHRSKHGESSIACCPAPPRESSLAVLSLPPDLEEGLGNSGDLLALSRPDGGKLLWFVRHGQSTGNAAKMIAWAADAREGGAEHQRRYEHSLAYIDAPLTELGTEQASTARERVAAWSAKPLLIICSPLTRAIQTAALVFERELENGTARLVIRPELREFFPENNENSGRPLAELRCCPRLRSLARWPDVEKALSDDATAEWRLLWDSTWARGAEGAWQAHVADVGRLAGFSAWLAQRPEAAVAVVSHFGAINNFLNLEPWADGLPRVGDPSRWPCGGLARRFQLQNCSWVAVLASPRVSA